MRVLIQRVKNASVHVGCELIGEINQGLLAFVGMEPSDNTLTLTKMADKLMAYRVFNDTQGKMNLNLREVNGGLLLVSQFTLAADTQRPAARFFHRRSTGTGRAII
jgi:D-aminoacyl-tRNA deacylase